MESIKFVNFIEIGQAVIEIQRIKVGNIMVPVNRTLMCFTPFLAADT